MWVLDWCYLCKCKRELVNHLLLHCPDAKGLWSMVFGLFGVYWVKRQWWLLASWQGRLGHHLNGVIWKAISHCLMWYIWREQNDRSFEDSERTLPDLKLFFFKTLLDWKSVVGC